MAQVRLRIVGECVIEIGTQRVTPTSPQLFALLLFLGLEQDREVSRSELIDLLYPASSARGESSHRLRQTLYKLRGMDVPLRFSDRTVRVEARQVTTDADDLLNGSWELRRDCLGQSFQILPHYCPPVETAFVDWVERSRERLHHSLRQQFTRDMDIARRKADWRYLEVVARRTLELDPLNETAVLGLAEATARTGSKARAISILDAYRAELGEERANLALPASLLQKRIDASRERSSSVRREPIPLIGRERELESLLSQWQSARRGNAHLLWLTGNKSVGKSRLAEELGSSVLISGSGQVVTISMSPMDADRPLSLISTLANRLSSLPGAAGCDPTSLRALGRLSGSISIPSAVNPENVDFSYSEATVRNAICDLIACVSDERAILTIIDNAQHLDEASADLLDAVLTRVADKKLLVVMCGTAEPLKARGYTTLHLEPLSTSASQELWQMLISDDKTRFPAGVSDKCLDTAAGNPGHLHLVAHQVLQDPEQFLIPVDLITLTDRCLAQLTVHARFTLEAVVTLADVATSSGVAFLTGLATYDLLRALHDLESADLITNTASGLRCRSALIIERARATASRTVKSMMEAKAAEFLEKERSGERWSPAMAWRIASHWRQAGEAQRARAYLRACWQHAVSIGQPATASKAINEALSTTSNPEERASLLDDLIGTLQAAGDLRSVIAAVGERRALSERVHDTQARIAQLAFDEDEAALLRNSNPAAHIQTFRDHLESSLLNSQRRIRAARILMMAADLDLDPDLAAYAMRTSSGIEPADAHSRLLLSHVFLIYHTIFGDADEALRTAADIQAQTQSLERSWYTAMSDRNCAFARQLAAPGPSDYDSFRRALAQSMDAAMIPIALGHVGSLMSVLIDDGDLSGASTWLETAERLEQSVEPRDYAVDYLGARVDLSLLTGDFNKALAYMDIMEQCAPRYQATRGRNELFIYRLRVQQFCNQGWSPEIHLPRLLDYHERGKQFTRHDDHMEILWQALSATGQSGRASALLAEYLLLHRRERRACRFMLRERTKSDPAWEMITPSCGVAERGAT